MPFFVPVSRRAFVVSVALQDSIIDFGEVFLLRNFPENSYNQAILYSRKCLLLTFIGYKISLRFLELWAVFFLIALKTIMSLVMLIVTGALFGSFQEILNALAWGASLEK